MIRGWPDVTYTFLYNSKIAKFLSSPCEISKYNEPDGQNNTFLKEKVDRKKLPV